MTDLEDLLRETLHARADQAPLEHRVVAESLSATAHPRSPRAHPFALAAATIAVAATVAAGAGLSQDDDSQTATDESTGSASQSPTEPSPASGPSTLALTEYSNAVTNRIVQCLQDEGFAVVMNKNSQMTDGAGRDQLTYRVPPALQEDPDYNAASLTCTTAAEAAEGPAPFATAPGSGTGDSSKTAASPLPESTFPSCAPGTLPWFKMGDLAAAQQHIAPTVTGALELALPGIDISQVRLTAFGGAANAPVWADTSAGTYIVQSNRPNEWSAVTVRLIRCEHVDLGGHKATR